MASRWTTEDLVDLEYLLGQDAEAFEDDLRRRDRKIYLGLQPGDAVLPRRPALRGWLERRRDEMRPLPGPAVGQGWRAVGLLVAAAGLLAGGSLAAGLLHYTGDRPINVTVALGLLVGLQVLSLLLVGAGFLVRAARRTQGGAGPPTRFLRGLVARASSLLGGPLESSRASAWRGYAGLIRSVQRLYGRTFFWSVFARLQSFGVAFNVGILLVLLFKVMTADLAFGWQTTLQGGAETVHALARGVAVPWSWLAGEGVGYPSLEAVEGSRIVLKDGIAERSGEHLAAWWPFLCLAVLFYGLLPRVVLHLLGIGMTQAALVRIPFRHPPCERLYRRMTVPLLGMAGEPGVADLPDAAQAPGQGSPLPSPDGAAAGPVLVPHDLADALGPEGLRRWLAPRVPGGGEPILFGRDVEEDRAALRRLGEPGAAYVVCEAWRPPIREFEDFLGDTRDALGAETPIWVLAAGRVLDTGEVAPPKDGNLKIWRDALARLGDPYLGLPPAGGPHGA